MSRFELVNDAEAYSTALFEDIPATDKMLTMIRQEQERNPLCSKMTQFCLRRWPEPTTLKGELKQCHSIAGEISCQDGLLLRGSRIVIPQSLQLEILQKIHAGDLGIVKCRERANQSIWWPNLSRELKEYIQRCDFV